MGVSLERVQFKFASIIGELCSEPVVLSQFAIWLDLRLAEYKSKGAISLDCSGEKPDPSWLKGLRAATSPATAKRVLGSRVAPRSSAGLNRGGMYSRSSAFHRRGLNSNSSRPSHPQTQSQRLGQSDMSERLSSDSGDRSHSQGSDDVVLIKDDPDADSSVYPISLHAHQIGESSERKRSATESVSGDTQNDSASPYKVRKSPTEDSSLNQSLMSVLGTSIDDNDQNPDLSLPTGTNESSTPATEMDYSISLQDQTGDSSSFHQAWADNSADFQSSVANTSSTSTFTPSRPSTSSATGNSAAGDNQSADADQSTQNVYDGGHQPPAPDGKKQAVWAKLWARAGLQAPSTTLPSALPVPILPKPSMRPSSRPSFSPSPNTASKMSAENMRRRDRIKVNVRPRTTVNYMIAAVGTFERWLWSICSEERREIFEIPPEELDAFLAEFFHLIKKPCGGLYNPESFISLRSRLDSYLKDNDYPCSITKSELFVKSQLAFKMRKQELKEAHAESMQ